MSVVELERSFVEALVGRTLRRSEQAIDVLRLDQALNAAKEDLEQAIRAEMLRATASWVAGQSARPFLSVTPEMTAILDELFALGQEEARLELERLGYDLPPARAFVDSPAPEGRDVEGYLRRELPVVTTRIEDELVTADLSAAGQHAIAKALLQVPGARDIASRIISTALIDGLATTFEEHADLVQAWEYTAVLDGRGCSRCEPLNGKRYPSLEALFVDLPNFGPNPRCKGGGRCRCRAVPIAAAPPVAPAPEAPPAAAPHLDVPRWAQPAAAAREARAALDEAFRHFKTPVARLADELGSMEAAQAEKTKLETFLRRENERGEHVPAGPIQHVETAVIDAGHAIGVEIDARVVRAGVSLDEIPALEAELEAGFAEGKPLTERYNAISREMKLEVDTARSRFRQDWIAAHPELDDLAAHYQSSVAWTDSPELKAIIERRRADLDEIQAQRIALRDRLAKVNEAKKAAESAYQEEIRRQTIAVLEESGVTMGPGELKGWAYRTKGRTGKAKVVLDQAADLYPRAWIERAHAGTALKPSFTARGRGYFSGPEKIVVSGGDRSKVAGDLDGFATAIHELGHYQEDLDPRLRALEWAFYQRRTRAAGLGEQEREFRFPRGAGYGAHESYRHDEFTEAYMGKTYGNGPTSSYELLTMGLETLWTGSYKLDPEMRSWILGLLATL